MVGVRVAIPERAQTERNQVYQIWTVAGLQGWSQKKIARLIQTSIMRDRCLGADDMLVLREDILN